MEKVDLILATPSVEDAKEAFSLRNEEETVLMSCSGKKEWESFLEEYRSYFAFLELPPFFISKEGKKCGFIYFSYINHHLFIGERAVEISINVKKEERGHGVGFTALKMVIDRFQNKETLCARIKNENSRSKHLFEKFNFSLVAKEEKGGVLVDVYYLKDFRKERSVFIIAEAGSNWDLDLKRGFEMIEVAKEAGADAVKFQTFKAKNLYVKNAGKAPYLDQDMEELFLLNEMKEEHIPKLYEKAKEVGIEWMSTPFSKEDFFAVDPFVKRHKIASYEIGYLQLIELVAKSKKPLILSTGASIEEEIALAKKTFFSSEGTDLTLLQCTAAYPAPLNALHLSSLIWLKNRFGVKSGLSDHSTDPFVGPLVATALGANCIEKHFTLSKKLSGPDHFFALEPDELKQMIQKVREAEKALGEFVKKIDLVEEPLHAFAKRGLQAISDIYLGERFEFGKNIDILRPGNQLRGIAPVYLREVEGKYAKRTIFSGDGIQFGDF